MFSIGSKLLFVFSIGWLMNVMFVSSICILTWGLCSQFYNDFIVSKRSPREVQNWTSFGLLFDIWIEDTNCEEEFGPNQDRKEEFVATNECISGCEKKVEFSLQLVTNNLRSWQMFYCWRPPNLGPSCAPTSARWRRWASLRRGWRSGGRSSKVGAVVIF